MADALSPAADACPVPMLLLSNGKARYECGEIPHSAMLTPDDIIAFALPSRTVHDIGIDLMWRRCIAVTSEFYGFTSQRFTWPLISWGAHIVEMLSFRAAGRGLSQRGFNEDGNTQIEKRYEEAGKWMEDIRDHKIHPDVIESSPAVPTPRCSSLPMRGW